MASILFAGCCPASVRLAGSRFQAPKRDARRAVRGERHELLSHRHKFGCTSLSIRQHHDIRITNDTGCDTVWSASSTRLSVKEVRLSLLKSHDMVLQVFRRAIIRDNLRPATVRSRKAAAALLHPEKASMASRGSSAANRQEGFLEWTRCFPACTFATGARPVLNAAVN